MENCELEPPQLDLSDAELDLELLVLRSQIEAREEVVRELIPGRDASHEDFMFHLMEGSNAWALGDKALWGAHKTRRDKITKQFRKPLDEAKEALADVVEKANPLEDELLRREGRYWVYTAPTLGQATRTASASIHSPEWHVQRAKGVGGSDIAAILGVSPWTTRQEVLELKAGISAPDTQRSSGALRRGVVHEEAIARRYARVNDDVIFVHCKDSWQSTLVAHQNANLDGLAYGADAIFPSKVVEIKTSSTPDSWVEGVPVYYRLQALWYMDAFGIQQADFAVLLDDVNYRQFTVEPLPGEMLEIHQAVDVFMDEVRELKNRSQS